MVANGNDGAVRSGRQNITVVNIAPSDVGQPCSDFDQLYAGVGQPYAGVAQPYAGVAQPYAGVGQSYTVTGQPHGGVGPTYSNIGQPFEDNGQRFKDADQSCVGNPNQSLSRQRLEPLQILDVDLEEYLEAHGCIIQRTFINLPLDLNSFTNESYEESEEEAEQSGSIMNFCHDDVITEQRATITLQRKDNFAQSRSTVTVNKGFIVDQNVGVSGEVSMVHLNRPIDQAEEFSRKSPAKRSPTIVYIGTIEEIEEDVLVKQVDVLETIEEHESGPSSITLSFYETSPEVVRKSSTRSKKSNDDTETVAEDGGQSLEKSALVAPALLMQWRVRPPDSEDAPRDDVDLPATPSSSMFSSAYTVTELGSDNSSDHSPPSESSNSTISSRRASEKGDGFGRPDDCYLKFQEYLQLFRQLSAFNNALFSFDDSSEVNSTHSSSESAILERESRAGSNRSIVFNYIPSRDQREKEEEELWVANEATYSTPGELCDGEECRDAIPKKTPQATPAVNFLISQEISETKDKSTSTSFNSQENTKGKSQVQMATSATQTVYSCLLPSSYYSVPRRSNQQSSSDRESAGSDDALSGLPSVPPQTLLREVDSDSASRMATLLCSVNTAERRHFSARQRLVEPAITKVEQNVKETTKKSSPDSPVGTNKELKSGADAKSCPVTSAATNQPTKRFSFLIRSNSMEQKDKITNTSVSASDKAILAKLAELKLEDIKENTNQKKATSSTSLHPPCRRCQQPVYPQEKIQTSRDILFHSSCFKCYQCGARLNLKTFYRNPLTLRDHRIFCKSHVPALDPGRVFQECKALGLPVKAETISSATSCRSSLVSPAQANGERVVVKGDTQGLRYF